MSFYTDVIKKDARFVFPKRVADTSLLFPEMLTRVQAVIADAETMGIKLMVFETFRSQARQLELFKQGASHLKQVGVHNYGLAVDLVKNVAGEPSWKGDFSFLGPIARKHGLVWGGDWGHPEKLHTFVDAVHLQFVSILDQHKLFDGSWYPDKDYNPYQRG